MVVVNQSFQKPKFIFLLQSMFEVLNKNDRELLNECEVDTLRASGAGGTRSDTAENTVRIQHEPTGIQVKAQDTRSQQKNRELALRRLRRKYALQIRHEVDPEQIRVPPNLESYIQNGFRIKQKNQWYPFLVKFVLDLFNACEGRLSETSDQIDTSTGQLVSFLKSEKQLRSKANEIREQHGHHKIQ